MITVNIKNGRTETTDGDNVIIFRLNKYHIMTVPYPDDKDEFIQFATVGAHQAVHEESDSVYYLGMALHSLIFTEKPELVNDVMVENKRALPWWKRCYLKNILASIPMVALALQE